jgi:hypothetical protein
VTTQYGPHVKVSRWQRRQIGNGWCWLSVMHGKNGSSQRFSGSTPFPGDFSHVSSMSLSTKPIPVSTVSLLSRALSLSGTVP